MIRPRVTRGSQGDPMNDHDETRRAFIRQTIKGLASTAMAGAASGLACGGSGPSIPAPCPPESPNCQVLAIQGGPNSISQPLWETVRSMPGPQGAWSPLVVVPSGFLPTGSWLINDLDQVAVPQGSPSGCRETHFVMSVSSGPLTGLVPGDLLYHRQLTNGTWKSFFTLSEGGMNNSAIIPGKPWRFFRVSAANVNGELHVCGVTMQQSGISTPAGLYHAVRRHDARLDAVGSGVAELAQWVGWTDVLALTGNPGTVSDVACAGVRNPATGREELQVCIVTANGLLLHAVRAEDGTWTPFGDVEQVAGTFGPFSNVDCAASGDLLHVVAATRALRAGYTIRSATSWRTFEDLQTAAGPAPVQPNQITRVGIGLFNEGLPSGQWQLIVVTTGTTLVTVPVSTFYTIRASQPTTWDPGAPASLWKPWANFQDEAGSTTTGEIGGVCVTSRPLLT
jgi:hypothetical protein